jgi:hypothetical protein
MVSTIRVLANENMGAGFAAPSLAVSGALVIDNDTSNTLTIDFQDAGMADLEVSAGETESFSFTQTGMFYFRLNGQGEYTRILHIETTGEAEVRFRYKLSIAAPHNDTLVLCLTGEAGKEVTFYLLHFNYESGEEEEYIGANRYIVSETPGEGFTLSRQRSIARKTYHDSVVLLVQTEEADIWQVAGGNEAELEIPPT